MTISSSLNAGVSGLASNASKLATISDNIANSGTYGYKRATTDFQSMVLSGAKSSTYVAGGVRASNLRMIDTQGPLLGTDNATDLAVDGGGFLPVSDVSEISDSSGTRTINLVTTGSFRRDANGILTTATGQVLMGWPADTLTATHVFPRDTLASLQPVQIAANQFVANPTTALSLAVNVPASSTVAGYAGDSSPLAVEYYSNLGGSESLLFDFEPIVPATGQSDSWTLKIYDGASNNSQVGEYVLTFSNSQTNGGTLASVTTVSGGAYNPTTGAMDINVEGGTIALDIGTIGQIDGMTQLSTSFTPMKIEKDGSPVASLQSVAIDDSGFLYAIYDQGFTRQLYQIPVVAVPNPNGLTALDNQTYKMSVESGPIYLWDSGDGPTGKILGYTREESSIDVANELTQLITTQRAYSSNAKVIQTVDEMLQETNGIKR